MDADQIEEKYGPYDEVPEPADKPDQEFKADAGKTKPDLIEMGFPEAIRGVQATTDYGSIKYDEHSWRTVPDGLERYARACGRHRQERQRDYVTMGLAGSIINSVDAESGLPHIVHEMFCLMAMYELALADLVQQDAHGVCSAKSLNDTILAQVKHPPLDHKKADQWSDKELDVFVEDGPTTPLHFNELKEFLEGAKEGGVKSAAERDNENRRESAAELNKYTSGISSEVLEWHLRTAERFRKAASAVPQPPYRPF